MQYLPSKNFIVILIATIVMGTGVFLLLDLFKKEAIFTQKNTGDSSVLGIVASDRNTVFGNITQENTELFGTPALKGEAIGGAKNLTEELSRELLTTLILGGNTEVDETTISNALNTLFEKTAIAPAPQIYSKNNIRVILSSPSNLKIYGNEFMTTVRKYAGANAANTLNTFEYMLKTQDKNSINILNRIADEYRKMESGLLSLSVPETIAASHIEFINKLRAIGNAVTDMGAALVDPVRGTYGLSAYIRQLNEGSGILGNINSVFESEKIVFSETESGYAWRGFRN